MNQLYTRHNFLWLLILLNMGLAAYAIPVTDTGDASEYIRWGQSFLGEGSSINLAHRSPFYSIVLAGFMLLFKPPLLYKLVVFFHYALVTGTVWMVYLQFRHLFSTKKMAMLAALLFNVSFSTIYFANILETEILTAFFVVLSLTLLMKIHEKGSLAQVIAYGTAVGLLSLTRFNAVPLIFTFFLLLCISLFRQMKPARKWIFSLVAFIVPYLFIINAWCLYNQYHNGFYGLFPHSGQRISRNIIVASIRPEDSVSAINKPLLDIFIKARATYLKKPEIKNKSSLSEFDKFDFLTDLYSGYPIYTEARPELCRHFHLPGSSGEYELSVKLTNFYQEIAKQNQGFILKFRFISLLSSFRASSNGDLSPEYGNINLNILPAFVLKLYGISFLCISLFVFFAFFFFIWKDIKNSWHFDFTLLAMFMLVFSFWGINFAFVSAGNANRFKFPVEPLILGLFVFYVVQTWEWLVQWKDDRHIGHRKLKPN